MFALACFVLAQFQLPFNILILWNFGLWDAANLWPLSCMQITCCNTSNSIINIPLHTTPLTIVKNSLHVAVFQLSPSCYWDHIHQNMLLERRWYCLEQSCSPFSTLYFFMCVLTIDYAISDVTTVLSHHCFLMVYVNTCSPGRLNMCTAWFLTHCTCRTIFPPNGTLYKVSMGYRSRTMNNKENKCLIKVHGSFRLGVFSIAVRTCQALITVVCTICRQRKL